MVKNSQYQLAWGYSLDGGETFTSQIPDDSVTLTEEEMSEVTGGARVNGFVGGKISKNIFYWTRNIWK